MGIMLFYNLMKQFRRRAPDSRWRHPRPVASVGPGNFVLRDIIGSRQIPVVRLTRIFRRAQSSRMMNAHMPSMLDSSRISATAETPISCPKAEDAETIPQLIVESLARDHLSKTYGYNAKRDTGADTHSTWGNVGAGNLNTGCKPH